MAKVVTNPLAKQSKPKESFNHDKIKHAKKCYRYTTISSDYIKIGKKENHIYIVLYLKPNQSKVPP